jgi:hypothetical protein
MKLFKKMNKLRKQKYAHMIILILVLALESLVFVSIVIEEVNAVIKVDVVAFLDVVIDEVVNEAEALVAINSIN